MISASELLVFCRLVERPGLLDRADQLGPQRITGAEASEGQVVRRQEGGQSSVGGAHDVLLRGEVGREIARCVEPTATARKKTCQSWASLLLKAGVGKGGWE